MSRPPTGWSIAPYFAVDDVVATANYYRDKLGFGYERLWNDPPSFCMVRRSGVIIMLSQLEQSGVMRPNRLVDPEGGAWDAYIWIEPTETGHRLRFGTLHGGARASIGAGLGALGVTAIVTVSSAFGGYLGDAIPGIALLFLAGVGMVVSGALRLPRWARLRGRQMEALAARVVQPPSSEEPPNTR